MTSASAICIVVDRLHIGMLGPYGNTWVHTPQLDRLASQSFTFDQAIVSNLSLDSFYWSCWRGIAEPDAPASALQDTLPRCLERGGVHTVLVSDEPGVLRHPLTAQFSEQLNLSTIKSVGAADDVASTAMGQVFGAATAWIAEAPPSFCLWLHLRGMAGPWDAPRALRREHVEEGDPMPPNFVEVPNHYLSDGYDPDELLGIVHAYAGQVSVLDACIGALLDALVELERDANTHLVFMSSRGFPLGEHRRVGACDEALYSELIHMALMIRSPDGLGGMARSPVLVQPGDLPFTLLEAWGIDHRELPRAAGRSLMPLVRGRNDSPRDHILCRSATGERALRTPAWHLRAPCDGAIELYAKPSDRWEVNEVSSRAPEVVGGLQAVLQGHEQAGDSAELAPLEELLVTEME